MKQEDVALELGVSRSTVAQMELGNRPVTSLELDRLAYLYGRDIREFLADEFRDRDAFAALFRGQVDRDEPMREVLRRCMSLGREMTNLERLIGVGRGWTPAATYPVADPQRKWDAIEQGEEAAEAERRRLGLGSAPVSDFAEVLEAQGVRTLLVALPENVSGLTLMEPSVGVIVVANGDHHVHRQRFSYAHEYAHVLFDRARLGLISRTEDRDDLIEVRANSFAAGLLMPKGGVEEIVASFGKGSPSRLRAAVLDGGGIAVPVEARSEPGTQDMQLYDVLHLAHHFWVSPIAALYRLKNLRLVTEEELQRLKAGLDEKRIDPLWKILFGSELKSETVRDDFRHRFLGLALEAYRREAITRAKLDQLAAMFEVSGKHVDVLLEGTGLGRRAKGDVLLPGR